MNSNYVGSICQFTTEFNLGYNIKPGEIFVVMMYDEMFDIATLFLLHSKKSIVVHRTVFPRFVEIAKSK